MESWAGNYSHLNLEADARLEIIFSLCLSQNCDIDLLGGSCVIANHPVIFLGGNCLMLMYLIWISI